MISLIKVFGKNRATRMIRFGTYNNNLLILDKYFIENASAKCKKVVAIKLAVKINSLFQNIAKVELSTSRNIRIPIVHRATQKEINPQTIVLSFLPPLIIRTTPRIISNKKAKDKNKLIITFQMFMVISQS
jgi:hypothetical protein